MEDKVENVEDSSKKVRRMVDLDYIVENEIGQFGWYQFRVLVMVWIGVMFTAFAATEYIFTTGRISTRCLIPECESLDSAQWSPPWLQEALPASGVTLDQCQRYAPAQNTTNTLDCPNSLFDQTIVIPCEEFVYENTDTIVYDYDLACKEWQRSAVGTFRTFGTLVALPLVGFISDRWGRRFALAVSCFNTCWIGLLRYFANTFIGFTISEFAEAAFGSGIFSTAYILAMELVGSKYRVVVGASLNSFFAVGQVLVALVAWGLPNWRDLTLALYAPMLLTISYFWLMSESVRWYMSKGRYDQSEKLLKKIAQFNNKQLSEDSLEALRINAEYEKTENAAKSKREASEPWLIVKVFKNKPILKRCLVSPVWWVTATFIYYGLSINAVNLSGNKYLNYIYVSAVEIPGYWIAMLLLGKVGRKPVLIVAFWICAACQMAYIFIPDGLPSLTLSVYLIGKLSIACVMTSIYVYTAELYPTEFRHSLFGYSSMVGRIGSMLAPLTPALAAQTWDKLPNALFAAFSFTSGLLVLTTPETFGTKLPDTMQEAATIGRNNKK